MAIGVLAGAAVAAIVDASLAFERVEVGTKSEPAPPRLPTIEPTVSVGVGGIAFGLGAAFCSRIGTDDALNLGMTTHANRRLRGVRYLAPALSAVMAAAAGCGGFGGFGGDEAVGLASIKSARVHVSHDAANTPVLFVAEITLPGGASCPPPLAPDLAITANGTPMQLSVVDGSDSSSCPSLTLEGRATLPETGGPLDVELTQGGRRASFVIARSAFPAIGPIALSRTAVPVGESFSVDVVVSGADESETRQLAISSDWIASLCDPSGCVPGAGWIGMPPTNAGLRDGGVGFDVVVPDAVPTGNWLLGVHLSKGSSFHPTITDCSGLPSCAAYNYAGQNWDFGPFNFDVL